MEGSKAGFLKVMLFASLLHDLIFGFFFLFFLPQMENLLLFPEPLNYPIFAHAMGLFLMTLGVIQLISFLNLERFIIIPFIVCIERIGFFIIGIVNIVYMPESIFQVIAFILIELFLSMMTIISIKLSRLSLRLQ
ncbi:MAG: hypothetical protein GF329_16415 [Candidatus Lokiarchaeota archaeon]|nr:hypothetical protein [Candidatus Lokiarchaeota archaeon]